GGAGRRQVPTDGSGVGARGRGRLVDFLEGLAGGAHEECRASLHDRAAVSGSDEGEDDECRVSPRADALDRARHEELRLDAERRMPDEGLVAVDDSAADTGIFEEFGCDDEEEGGGEPGRGRGGPTLRVVAGDVDELGDLLGADPLRTFLEGRA